MRPTAEIPKGKYSEKEKSDILRDVTDPQKITLVCGKHNYIGAELPPPPIGCVDCQKAHIMYKIGQTPPHLRQERLEAWYRAVYDAVKMYERGEFDFEPFEHAMVKMEKE